MKLIDPTIKATIEEACRVIIKDAPHWAAKSYANACLNGSVQTAARQEGNEPRAYKIQINYILCNVANWRGDIARNTKSILKGILKQLV